MPLVLRATVHVGELQLAQVVSILLDHVDGVMLAELGPDVGAQRAVVGVEWQVPAERRVGVRRVAGGHRGHVQELLEVVILGLDVRDLAHEVLDLVVVLLKRGNALRHVA